jgi:pimeloyl-ACP methyl ester carboxylesterase
MTLEQQQHTAAVLAPGFFAFSSPNYGQTMPISETESTWNEVDKGGHFAANEQPQIFAEEMRAALRSLRQ